MKQRWITLGALFLALCVLVQLPVWLSPEIPPLDLANHLGRAYLLGYLPDHPGLQALYEVRAVLTPNLAADLLLTPLVRLLGMDFAVRLFVSCGLLLQALAFAALSREARGRFDETALLGVPLAHYHQLNYGFINYYYGILASLLALAVWLRVQAAERVPRAAWVGLPALALFVYTMHLVGFGVLLVGAGATMLERGPLRPWLRRALLLGLMAAVPIACYIAFSRGVVGGQGLHRVILWAAPQEKLLGLLRVLRAARPVHDAPLFVLLGWLLLHGLLLRRFRESAPRRRLLRAGVVLLVLALTLPNAFDLESSAVDLRVAAPAFLVLVAALAEWPGGRLSLLAFALLTFGTAARTTGVLARWRIASQGIRESRRLCDLLPEGARVFTLHNEVPRPGTVEHEAGERHGWAYCLPRRPLFFPALFHVPGSQPLVLRLPTYEGGDTLAHFHVRNGFSKPEQAAEIPWRELWALHDYVWLTNWDLPQADPRELLPRACVEEVGRTGLIALYRLRKNRPGCP